MLVDYHASAMQLNAEGVMCSKLRIADIIEGSSLASAQPQQNKSTRRNTRVALHLQQRLGLAGG